VLANGHDPSARFGSSRSARAKQFDRPLVLNTLIRVLPDGLRALVKNREGDRGRWFPPSVWFAVTNFLKEAFPERASALERLLELANAGEEIEIGRHTQRLAMQRDAVGLSLDIAGLSDIRRQQFRRVLPIRGETSSPSFIELMDAQPPQERMLIVCVRANPQLTSADVWQPRRQG
jgi:hypothetical protein